MKELYTTDLKYLIPIIGVLVGWFLTSISGFLKGITEKQRALGKAITQLHFIYWEQRKLLNYFDFLKKNNGINPEYERMRLRAMERYVLVNDNLQSSIETVESIAAIYPITAMDLKSIIESYSFSQKMKFPSSSQDPELYIRLLSIFEVGFELDHRRLKKIIFRLAFGHGVVTWLKMWRKYSKINKNLNSIDAGSVLGIDNDLRNLSKKATNAPSHNHDGSI